MESGRTVARLVAVYAAAGAAFPATVLLFLRGSGILEPVEAEGFWGSLVGPFAQGLRAQAVSDAAFLAVALAGVALAPLAGLVAGRAHRAAPGAGVLAASLGALIGHLALAVVGAGVLLAAGLPGDARMLGAAAAGAPFAAAVAALSSRAVGNA